MEGQLKSGTEVPKKKEGDIIIIGHIDHVERT